MLSCKNCRFCRPVALDTGFCRRYPPTLERLGLDKTPSGTFPAVSLTQFWCGEFRLRLWPRWLKLW